MAIRCPRMGVLLIIVLIFGGAVLTAGWVVGRWTDIPLLLPEGGADWIRPDTPFLVQAEPASRKMTAFRTEFDTASPEARAVLHVRAMKSARVSLDGRVILPFPERKGSWKAARQVDLAPYLLPGRHHLEISVANDNGPLLLLAYCRELGLYTNRAWKAGTLGAGWQEVRLASDTAEKLPSALLFPSAATAFFQKLPVLLGVLILVGGIVVMIRPGNLSWECLQRLRLGAGTFRWLLLFAWAILSVNNLRRIPLNIGYDVEGHLQYIAYLLDNMRLPLASEGWEMYHAPLYYVLSALLYAFCTLFTSPGAAIRLIRIIPLLCGGLQIEIAFRVLRKVFPGRDELQAAGTLVAGFIPMNIYISQYISNESLAAVLVASTLFLCFTVVVPPVRMDFRHLAVMGLALGAALLAKMSALFLVPVVMGAVFWTLFRQNWRIPRIMAAAGTVLGVTFLVAGWFYVRNAVVFGKPFVSNWGTESGFFWWQGPGFRTPEHLLGFGESLVRPAFSGIYHFWDAIYSTFWLDGYLGGGQFPPWNYQWMTAGAWLGLIPTGVMLLGAVMVIVQPQRQGTGAGVLSISAICVYFAALLFFATTTPYYSTGKAFYALGLLPCFGILAGFGFDFLFRRTILRAVTWGLLACWATASYAAYFAIR